MSRPAGEKELLVREKEYLSYQGFNVAQFSLKTTSDPLGEDKEGFIGNMK